MKIGDIKLQWKSHMSLDEKWHYEIQVFKEGYTYSKVGGDSHDEAIEKAIWYCINNLIK